MTLLQLFDMPKELVVQLEGVSCPVRPRVEYVGSLGREPIETPVLSRQDGFEQLYTPDLFPIYKGLMRGTLDNYSSLSQSQPLVQTGKLTKEIMADVLSRFSDEVLKKYTIWAELLDWQPQKRNEGYGLKNPLLYRNWNLSKDGKIDVSKAEKVKVKWMKESGVVGTWEIVEQLGVPKNMYSYDDDTYVHADRDRAVNDFDGLNALLWDFRLREFAGGWREGLEVELDSEWSPRIRYSNAGALLGRRMNA